VPASTTPSSVAGWRTWEGLPISIFAPDVVAAEIAGFAESYRAELRRCERAAELPKEIYREMGARGWVGSITPTESGGLGGGAAEYCFLQEQTARHGLVSPQVSVQGQQWLLEWGTPAQQEKYLRRMAEGSLVFSESISEPHAGSSFKNMAATARRANGAWILNGRKTHVNLGADAELTAFYAIADEGLTSFLVETDTAGITTRRTDPIGLRMLPTADVIFEDVRVSDEALLGPPGRGMATFLSVFNLSRLGNASELIGLSCRALALAIDYARERKVGEHVVTQFQGIQWAFTDCYTKIYAATLARQRAVVAAEANDPALGLYTAIAKNLAAVAAEDVTRDMFALIGGHGLYHTQDFATILNDVKVLRVAGGSLEVLRNYIGKQILGSDTYLGLR
jgi:alkylation response protein AidB-like acyl-CoA dehydrogenase